jgi:hypothetical protein
MLTSKCSADLFCRSAAFPCPWWTSRWLQTRQGVAPRGLWPQPNHALGELLADRLAQRACDFFEISLEAIVITKELSASKRSENQKSYKLRAQLCDSRPSPALERRVALWASRSAINSPRAWFGCGQRPRGATSRSRATSLSPSYPWPVPASLRSTGTPVCVLCMECSSPRHRQECRCYPRLVHEDFSTASGFLSIAERELARAGISHSENPRKWVLQFDRFICALSPRRGNYSGLWHGECWPHLGRLAPARNRAPRLVSRV